MLVCKSGYTQAGFWLGSFFLFFLDEVQNCHFKLFIIQLGGRGGIYDICVTQNVLSLILFSTKTFLFFLRTRFKLNRGRKPYPTLTKIKRGKVLRKAGLLCTFRTSLSKRLLLNERCAEDKGTLSVFSHIVDSPHDRSSMHHRLCALKSLLLLRTREYSRSDYFCININAVCNQKK